MLRVSLPNFRRKLLSWFAEHGRDLPWRHTRDPWLILVSEVMLQQTQVGRVIPKYGEFVRRYPTAAALAGFAPSEIIAFWSGLGYNRRALNLWKAAGLATREFGGTIPEDDAALRALPGIGSYTAAAIAAFAGNRDVVAVDTNVRRIFLRIFFGGEYAEEPGAAELDSVMRAALPRGRSREWHSALMDFGSLVCTSRAPSCEACPLARECRARRLAAAGAALRTRLNRKQPRFEGSRRQLRGRILRVLSQAAGPLDGDALCAAAPSPEFLTCLGQLMRDGLVAEAHGLYRLPAHADTLP